MIYMAITILFWWWVPSASLFPVNMYFSLNSCWGSFNVTSRWLRPYLTHFTVDVTNVSVFQMTDLLRHHAPLSLFLLKCTGIYYKSIMHSPCLTTYACLVCMSFVYSICSFTADFCVQLWWSEIELVCWSATQHFFLMYLAALILAWICLRANEEPTYYPFI